MFRVYLVVFIMVVGVTGSPVGMNNACDRFQAYRSLGNDREHCFYNPDVNSTPYQIAERYGFQLENHLVQTDDGYILSVFRISKLGERAENRQPALLQHGILVDAVSWMISGNGSLAFTLVAHGYDLWLPNNRGTLYSSRHVDPGISEKDYWNFSFHEMAVKDLPTIIEYVSKTTNRKDLIYIGHSMGTTTAFIYSSLLRNHAQQHLKGLICLAPVAYIRTLQGLLRLVVPFHGLLKGLLDFFGLHAVGQFTALQKLVTSLTCSRYPLITACQVLYAMSVGLRVDQVRPEILPVIMTVFPAAVSVKTMVHYAQMTLSGGRFQSYDYGPAGNYEKYNSSTPPVYRVEEISVPVHLFSGTNDFLATIADTKYLYGRLNTPKWYHEYNLAHTDYAFGKKVDELYADILGVMESGFTTTNVTEHEYT